MKIGKKVRIVDWKKDGRYRPSHWNSAGKMDEWCGKIVTIKDISCSSTYFIKEDKSRWRWHKKDFEEISYLEDELFTI